MADYWKGVLDGDPSPYLQRILAGSNATRGVDVRGPARVVEGGHAAPDERAHLPARGRLGAAPGGQALVHADRPARVLPPRARVPGGRRGAARLARAGRRDVLRPELDPLEQGAPVDQAAGARGLRRPGRRSATPRHASTGTSCTRGRSSARRSTRCTSSDPAYRFIFQTPKYRWGAHSTAVDADWIAMLFGPFGDPYRRDPRSPWTGEAYFEIHPQDAIGARPQRRRLRLDRRRSGRSPVPRLEGRRPVLRRRPRDDARPRLLRDDARPHPHVVQHVRRHAGHGRRHRPRPRATRPRTRRRTTSRSSATAATSRAPAPGCARRR